jgi:hypothetical protein
MPVGQEGVIRYYHEDFSPIAVFSRPRLLLQTEGRPRHVLLSDIPYAAQR